MSNGQPGVRGQNVADRRRVEKLETTTRCVSSSDWKVSTFSSIHLAAHTNGIWARNVGREEVKGRGSSGVNRRSNSEVGRP